MILVTGATGFLGSELVKQLLEQGASIRALKRDNSVIPVLLINKSNITWVDADLLDYFALEEALNGIEQVYHCAAYISFNPGDKKKMHQVNVEGTANLVNLCLEKNIKKLLHVSSVAAVGDGEAGKLITEDHQWEFNGRQNAYAVSKYESEMEVWRGIAEGLPAVIVNPSLIIGKNAGTKGSGALFETVRKGLKFYTGGTCGLVDVEDTARSMILLMQSGIVSQRFILNAENRSYREIFTQAASNFGIPPPSVEARPWMLGLAWRLAGFASMFTGKPDGLTRDTARSAFIRQNYSNEKIKKATGIEFKSTDTSIAEICANLSRQQPSASSLKTSH